MPLTRWSARRDRRWRYWWAIAYVILGLEAFFLTKAPLQQVNDRTHWIMVAGAAVALVGLFGEWRRPKDFWRWTTAWFVQIAGLALVVYALGGYQVAIWGLWDDVPGERHYALLGYWLAFAFAPWFIIGRLVDLCTYPKIPHDPKHPPAPAP